MFGRIEIILHVQTKEVQTVVQDANSEISMKRANKCC